MTCTNCGTLAEPNAKFCRQCGQPLARETHATNVVDNTANIAKEAPTMTYGRQMPLGGEARPVDTSQLPYGHTGGQTSGQASAAGQTPYTPPTPTYTAPPPPTYQPVTPATYNAAPASYAPPAVATAPKSNWWKWVLGIVLVLFLVCAGILAVAVRQASQLGRQVAQQVENEIKKAKENAPIVVPPSGNPGQQPAGNKPGPNGQKTEVATPELGKLLYPKATQTSHVKAMGQEVIEFTSTDEFDAIKAFYVKAVGEPMMESNTAESRTAMFQQGSFMVTVSETKGNEAKQQITIINSSLIPQLSRPKA